MTEEDIYEENGQFVIKKEINGKMITFGVYDDLDEAIENRDELEEYGWPYRPEPESVKEVEKFIFEEDGRFFISRKILDFDIVFGNFDSLDRAKTLKRKLIDNAWNVNFQTRPVKYGKYIQKTANNRFAISREFNGSVKRFGTYKSLNEALLVRDDLVSDNWGMEKDMVLPNLGVEVVDINIGQVGRRYAVFNWEGSKCTIYGIYRNYRVAKKVKKKLIVDKKNDLTYLDRHRDKDTKFIYRVGNYYRVSKSFDGELKHFGHYNSLDEAISIRDELIKNNWDDSFLGLRRILRNPNSYNKHIHKTSRGYDVVKRIDGELINFGSFETLEEAISYRDELEDNNWEVDIVIEEIQEEKYDEYIFLKSDGKYYVKNEIDGEMRIFGVFDNPLDAIGARLDCMKNAWKLSSVLEEDYVNNPGMNVTFGLLENEEVVESGNIFSEMVSDSIEFPVTVGKSYKNRGWAIKRSHLGDFVPIIPYEEECIVLVNGRPITGKINIHTRLFYFKDELLSDYLEKLYEIDPKIQTRIDLKLEHGKYKLNPNLKQLNNIFFITKFSKSFRKGLFAIPRSASELILPELPYEEECSFIIGEMEVRGKFNLEFRFKFSDKSVISSLNSEVDDWEELEVILLL
nr:hypothetical protein [uncultured Methanobrevibacter sp.]